MDYQAIILTVVSSICSGGLVAALNWWTQHQKAKGEVKRSEFDIVVEAMNELQEENQRLQALYTQLQADYQKLIDENALLRLTLARNGISIITGEAQEKKKRFFL